MVRETDDPSWMKWTNGIVFITGVMVVALAIEKDTERERVLLDRLSLPTVAREDASITAIEPVDVPEEGDVWVAATLIKTRARFVLVPFPNSAPVYIDQKLAADIAGGLHLDRLASERDRTVRRQKNMDSAYRTKGAVSLWIDNGSSLRYHIELSWTYHDGHEECHNYEIGPLTATEFIVPGGHVYIGIDDDQGECLTRVGLHLSDKRSAYIYGSPLNCVGRLCWPAPSTGTPGGDTAAPVSPPEAPPLPSSVLPVGCQPPQFRVSTYPSVGIMTYPCQESAHVCRARHPA